MRHWIAVLFLLTCCALAGWAQVKVSRVRVAENVMQGRLFRSVNPQQRSGNAAHISGEVVFKAVIGKDGSVESLQALSGHPMLIPAAIEAVKQWKYMPYAMNGEPLEVETTIRVTFTEEKKTSSEGMAGDIPGGAVPGQVGSVASPNEKRPLIPSPQRVRVSQGAAAGNLVERVDPMYPPKAKAQHIEGTVLLRMIINEQGQVEHAELINGHPLLAPAAIDAVKRWKYRPYMLNGEPVEVETHVQVNFSLEK